MASLILTRATCRILPLSGPAWQLLRGRWMQCTLATKPGGLSTGGGFHGVPPNEQCSKPLVVDYRGLYYTLYIGDSNNPIEESL